MSSCCACVAVVSFRFGICVSLGAFFGIRVIVIWVGVLGWILILGGMSVLHAVLGHAGLFGLCGVVRGGLA